MKQLLIEWKSNQMRKTTIYCEIGSPRGNHFIDEEEEEWKQKVHILQILV